MTTPDKDAPTAPGGDDHISDVGKMVEVARDAATCAAYDWLDSPEEQRDATEQMSVVVRAALESLGIPLEVLAELKAGTAKVARMNYGCHCDLEPGDVPDGCVIDEARPYDCVYAKKYSAKEDCPEWRPYFAVPKTPSEV